MATPTIDPNGYGATPGYGAAPGQSAYGAPPGYAGNPATPRYVGYVIYSGAPSYNGTGYAAAPGYTATPPGYAPAPGYTAAPAPAPAGYPAPPEAYGATPGYEGTSLLANEWGAADALRLLAPPQQFVPTGYDRRQLRDPMAARHRRGALEHRDVGGGWLRAAVFGAMDGLVTNASLIAGATGAHASNQSIILTGFAGLVAGAFSMATGEYISVSSQNEMTIAEVDNERWELKHNPEAELSELAEVFVSRGVEAELALEVSKQLSRDPEQALTIHAREELGVDPDDLPSPWTAAGASFAAFTVGALTPLLPYLLGFPNFTLALSLAGGAALVGGAVVAKAAKRSPLIGGVRQLALGGLATAMTFLVGQLVGQHVG